MRHESVDVFFLRPRAKHGGFKAKNYLKKISSCYSAVKFTSSFSNKSPTHQENIRREEGTIQLRHHTIASIGFGLVVYLFFKSFSCVLVCFLVGVFIDVDHYFDYIKHTGWNLNIKQFFYLSYGGKLDRFYLLFAAIIVISDYNLIIIAAGIGYAQHLILDQIFNQVKPFAYFLTYRLKNGFSKKRFLRDDFHISSK
jgi:hypothetical protein